MLGAGSVRRGALLGWLCGAGYFAVSLHWIVEPFLVDAGRHGWMAPFALFFSATGLALFWGAAFGLAAGAGGGVRRAAAWTAALAGAEMARSYLLTGFPWALVGYAWIDTPAAFWVRLVGPFGLAAGRPQERA